MLFRFLLAKASRMMSHHPVMIIVFHAEKSNENLREPLINHRYFSLQLTNLYAKVAFPEPFRDSDSL